MKNGFKIEIRNIDFGVLKMKVLEATRGRVYNILYSERFKEKHRMQENDFTRNRKLGFPETSIMILKGIKKGLHAGISEFLDETKSEIKEYSEAAFCKARQKINPEAFKELFETTVEGFYLNADYKTFNGYRVCAIDGSDINLPNTKELLEIYGSEPYSNGSTQVQSLVSCLYDVLNHTIIDASMNPYDFNERKAAIEHINKLDNIRTEKELIIMDRGYPSEELLKTLEDKQYKYLFRVNRYNFFREIRDAKTDDEILCREIDGIKLYYRLVLITLNNGTVEALITNLTDENITKETLSQLYNLRWGIETKYDDLKNKLQLENFSGVSSVCILQDFYSTMFLSNLLACMEFDCSQELDKINSSQQLKHEYKINTNHAIFVLRNTVVKMLISDSPRTQRKLMLSIEHDLLQCLTPVRNDRSFPRDKKHPSLKFSFNRKFH